MRKLSRMPAVLLLVALGACMHEDPVDPPATSSERGAVELRFSNFVVTPTQGTPVSVDYELVTNPPRVYTTGVAYGARTIAMSQQIGFGGSDILALRAKDSATGTELVMQPVTVDNYGFYDVYAIGRPGDIGATSPALSVVQRVPVQIPFGDVRVRMIHAIPDYAALDVYLNSQLVTTLPGYPAIEYFTVTPSGSDTLTITVAGTPPQFDDLLDVHHTTTLTLASSRSILVVGYRSGENTPGADRETVFVYSE